MVSGTVLAVLMMSAALLVVLPVVASCLWRANRLDRLHVRTDAARAALRGALERRAVVARAIATSTGDQRLHHTAALAEQASSRDRESCENDLSRLLSGLERPALPAELAAELADAEQRVMLGRRVYNDAVRDTVALRSRRFVRWLRLAGNAAVPTYFEISDAAPQPDGPVTETTRPRRAGRVVLLDPAGRVLLFEGFDPARPQEPYWFTPGGGLESGEDSRAAAARELAEETGMHLSPARLVGPIWRRRSVFSFDGDNLASDEEFFLADTGTGLVDTSGFTALERATVLGHHWWSSDELRTTGAVVYPRHLGELLGSLRLAGWDGVTRSIS